MTQANSGKPGIQVPARLIPPPSTVSPQAQAMLSRPLPQLDVPTPDVSNKAGWKQYIETFNRGLSAFAQMQAKTYPAETTTHALSVAPLYELAPKTLAADREKGAVLYLHGGGFVFGGGLASAHAAAQLASLTRMRTFSLDYRMPPDHPFPAAVEDAVEAYRWLLDRYDARNVAVYGPSAGGNLAVACLVKARDLGLPLPAACVVHSPASDLTESGDSYETNDTIDVVLKHRSPALFQLYADGRDLRDPLLSPIYADYGPGFPPTMLSSGTRDLLLSSTVLLHRALRRAGVRADLLVFEAMSHGGFFGQAPEDRELLDEHVQFMLDHLAFHSTRYVTAGPFR